MLNLSKTDVNFDSYFENRNSINEMIEKFGPEQVMFHLYQREDFIIPNYYDYRHIASMWGYTEESVAEKWDEIQYMIKRVIEQGGFNDVLEQRYYVEDFEIELVESE